MTALNKIRIAGIEQRDTHSRLIRDTPDQILVIGEFAGGATGVMRFEGSSGHGTGIRLEINGSRGDLLITPAAAHASMMQIWDLKITKTTSLGQFEELSLPDHYVDVPPHLAAGPALNVARSYLALARAMDGQQSVYPDFSDAIELHRTLDRITRASDQRAWVAAP